MAYSVPALLVESLLADDTVHLIAFDAEGGLTDVDALPRLTSFIAAEHPTDVIVPAHGWNNSPSAARQSYETIVANLKTVALRGSDRLDQYRPCYVGLVWPSRAWTTDESAVAKSEAGQERRLLDVYEAFDASRAPGTYHQDVHQASRLLAKPTTW